MGPYHWYRGTTLSFPIGVDLACILGDARRAPKVGWCRVRWGMGGVSPPQPTRGSGERGGLPVAGSGGRKRILAYFEGHRTLHFVPIWLSLRKQFALAALLQILGDLSPPWSMPMLPPSWNGSPALDPKTARGSWSAWTLPVRSGMNALQQTIMHRVHRNAFRDVRMEINCYRLVSIFLELKQKSNFIRFAILFASPVVSAIWHILYFLNIQNVKIYWYNL